MPALTSLRPAVGALRRNPILVAVVGLFGLVQLPQLALQAARPLLAALFSLVLSGVLLLVMPFFQGGLIGMADEAREGSTRLGTLVSVGKANYVTLLVAYLLVFAVNIAFGIAALLAVLFGGAGVFALDAGSNPAALGALAIVALLFLVAYLLVTFFIQFYAHAIVLSDAGIVDSFRRSIGLVRQNPVSVLGYSLLLFAGSAVFGGIGGAASMVLSPQATALPIPEVSTPILLGAGAVYVVAIAVLGAFYATYSVTFYRAIEETTGAA